MANETIEFENEQSAVKQKLDAGELVDVEGRVADLVDYLINEGEDDNAIAA